jgi:hypothetical protein
MRKECVRDLGEFVSKVKQICLLLMIWKGKWEPKKFKFCFVWGCEKRREERKGRTTVLGQRERDREKLITNSEFRVREREEYIQI